MMTPASKAKHSIKIGDRVRTRLAPQHTGTVIAVGKDMGIPRLTVLWDRTKERARINSGLVEVIS